MGRALARHCLGGMAVAAGLLLAGCSTGADVAAMNQEARNGPLPRVELRGRGFGGGPFRVTMPDGEVMEGRYSAPSTGLIMAGPFRAQAAGPRTTMTCQGNWASGQGGAECTAVPGEARYQILF